MLAGLGLALGRWFANVHLASSYDVNHLFPWGSHPDLDPLWSTERTATHLDGARVTRTNKVSSIASSDFALSRLKVCWREDIDTNCGRCEKCVRTQCALAIAGALDRAPVFLESLSIQAVVDLPALDQASPLGGQEVMWSELCESFPEEPRLAELRSAVLGRLPVGPPLSTAREQRDRPLITIEVPSGAALSLLPASAGEVLPVPVTRRERTEATDASACRVEITWTAPAPGRAPLPLRPAGSVGLEILDACRNETDRPNPWCLIAFASLETARLLERLTDSWGQGITCLTTNNEAEGDHGIPRAEACLIQQRSEMRVWWGGADYLDPFLVLEALRHGCLPLQCVPEASYDALAACLPPGLSHFTLAIPEDGPISPISKSNGPRESTKGYRPSCRETWSETWLHFYHSFFQVRHDMNINDLIRLPWKLKNVLRSVRRDLEDSRRATGELLQLVSALELRQREIFEQLAHTSAPGSDGRAGTPRKRQEQQMSSLGEMLLGEIREQGIIMETAASFSPRAAAEIKLREPASRPPSRAKQV